ncbi:ComEC/Rec2 family competence protein [Paenarthrobacter aurescens]|uniref:ComEC/Rec2 family competence protein n=1 Tax=Paenarthrobacter aurescens TaxID=43663 RepID=UPI0021BF19FF|nr:ComEC/Rec2 family competence protein [Paenarthrobacter aurescens]
MAESLGGPEAGKRIDLRLVPVVMVTWSVALAGGFIGAAWSVALAGALTVMGGVFLVLGRRQRPSGVRARTLFATLALACVLGAAVAVHCGVSADHRENGPLAPAVAADDGVVIHVLITGSPAAVRSPGHSSDDRWMVDASLIDLRSEGSVVRGSADIVITGGDGWQNVRPGQRIRTTGTLKQARDGQSEAVLLNASSGPVVTGSGFDVRQTAADVRKGFVAAAQWLPEDPAGLLPGMVTGDTSALPESLEAAMKTTGMTHLTAVSGANCSLVLGGFILLARCFRLVRPAAGAFAACGLLSFVVMVGPDPSVLRAAVMGAVGLAALTGGLRGRSLTFLCLATTILLLLDPAMAANVGFLLSVLATLGIVLLATRIASWIPLWVPRWLAAGIAVPLSAQLLCGPVIVALQPQFTPYALIANVAAGPLVAPVTIVGTIAAPLATVLPWLAVVPIAVAGACAGMVAGLARFFAALPGAALPWAEGPIGIMAMVLSSIVTMLVVWMSLHPADVKRLVMGLHGVVIVLLERGARRRHGRLEACKVTSGRNHLWLLPKTPGPRVPRRTPSVGGKRRPPP